MQFVPLWTSILRSRKVAGLSGDDYKFWTMCMLLAQEHDYRTGSLPSVADISYALHMSQKDCLSTLSTLVRGHFLDVQNGIYFVHDWDEWKLGKDPTGAEKKRRYREKKKRLAEQASGVIVPGHGGRPQMSTLSTHRRSVIETLPVVASLAASPEGDNERSGTACPPSVNGQCGDPPISPPSEAGLTAEQLAEWRGRVGLAEKKGKSS